MRHRDHSSKVQEWAHSYLCRPKKDLSADEPAATSLLTHWTGGQSVNMTDLSAAAGQTLCLCLHDDLRGNGAGLRLLWDPNPDNSCPAHSGCQGPRLGQRILPATSHCQESSFCSHPQRLSLRNQGDLWRPHLTPGMWAPPINCLGLETDHAQTVSLVLIGPIPLPKTLPTAEGTSLQDAVPLGLTLLVAPKADKEMGVSMIPMVQEGWILTYSTQIIGSASPHCTASLPGALLACVDRNFGCAISELFLCLLVRSTYFTIEVFTNNH